MAGEPLAGEPPAGAGTRGDTRRGRGKDPHTHHGPTSHLFITTGQGQCQEEPTTH